MMQPPLKHDDIGVIILAGGHSSRMKSPKPFLKINEKTLLRTLVEIYASLTKNIAVVLNHEWIHEKYYHYIIEIQDKARVIINRHPEKGKWHSIALGLENIKESSFYFIQNTDNPVSLSTLKLMAAQASAEGYTVPVCEGKGGHPVLISKKTAKAFEAEKDHPAHWREFLSCFPRITVETDDPLVMINLNLPEDYEKFIHALQETA
jgi:molybdenum cofactor cytidylyltransferase